MSHNANELKHWGVKGMHWGVRRGSPATRAEKKAAKYDKKAEKYDNFASRLTDKQASDATTARRIIAGAYQGINTAIILDKYGAKSLPKKDIINNMMITQLAIKNPKKNAEFKAETYRRKAEKIRNKAMGKVDKTRAKKTFSERAKLAMKDPYNQEKAKRMAQNAALAAALVYSNRQLIGLAARVGLNVAAKKVRERRARLSIPALPKKASMHKTPRMKSNTVYLVEPSGKLKKSGKFEVT